MELLHEDIGALNNNLSGMKVVVRGDEYYFSHFCMETERIPPVAAGYVLHLRLQASLWRWEEKDIYGNGKKRWTRSRYAFWPHEITFIAEKNPPEMPTTESKVEK